MTALAVEVNDLACGRCGMTTDHCLSIREDCCAGCTHYPEPVAHDLDEVAVARAVVGDMSVPLNRAEYAEAHRLLHDQGKSIREIAALLGATERTVDRWNQGHNRPISRRPGGRAMTTTDELLTSAARHPVKRIQTAARRAQAAIQRVHDLIAEDSGKAEAREHVERLERELREAKAALRGGRGKTSKPTAPSTPAALLACRKGCGKTSPNGQGRAAHERHCTHTADVVA